MVDPNMQTALAIIGTGIALAVLLVMQFNGVNDRIGDLRQGLQAQIGELSQDIRRVEDILIAGGGRTQSGGGGAPTVTPGPETDD